MLTFVIAYRIVWEFIIPCLTIIFIVSVGLGIYRRIEYKRIFEKFLRSEYEKLIQLAEIYNVTLYQLLGINEPR